MKTRSDRPLPSQHEDARKAGEQMALDREEEKKRQEARILAAFDWMLKQENGRLVWAWFFNRCGYNKTALLRMASGDVAPLSTECLAAQREVYLAARKMISAPELLAAAEFEAEFGIALKLDESKGEKK